MAQAAGLPQGRAASGEDAEAGETVEQSYTVEVSGKRFDVKVIGAPLAPER